jgi:hypothetical protein
MAPDQYLDRLCELYILGDAGCTTVCVDPSGVYTCTEGVIPPIQVYGLSGTVCTSVRMEQYCLYACTGRKY